MIGSALVIDPNPEFEAALSASKNRWKREEPAGFREGPEHVITGGRQEGKTRLALRWLNSAPEGVERVLIVGSTGQAEAMNKDIGLPARSPKIVAFRTVINQGARQGVEYGIDETVLILEELLGLHNAPKLVTVGHAEPWQTSAPPVAQRPRCETVSRGIRCALRPGHASYHSFRGPRPTAEATDA